MTQKCQVITVGQLEIGLEFNSVTFPNTIGKQPLRVIWKVPFYLRGKTPSTVPASELALSNWAATMMIMIIETQLLKISCGLK